MLLRLNREGRGMKKTFRKFRRAAVRRAAAFAVAGGLCAGLAVTGILLLVLKLCAVVWGWWAYLLVGVGVCAAVSAVCFFLFRPSDKELSKALDEEFSLDERVQTMVEYAADDGAMSVLQREDAAARLSAAPKRKLPLSAILSTAIAFAVACALFLTAIFVPAREKPVPDDSFELDVWEATALEQLIGEVKESSLQPTPKESVVAVLEELKAGLTDEQSATVMRAAVRSAAQLIAGITTAGNSASVFGERLAAEETELSDLGDALLASLSAYRAEGGFLSFDAVQRREPELNDAIAPLLSEGTEAMRNRLSELLGAKFYQALREDSAAIAARLQDSGVSETDALSVALAALSAELNRIAGLGDGYTLAVLNGYAANACDAFTAKGAEALSVQAYSCMMNEFIRNRLSAIFNVSLSDGSSSGGDGSGGAGGSDEEESSSGGGGSGGNRYGSDDVIYDPETGTYVPYGTLLEKYNSIVNELVREGQISAEMEKYIREYFNILYNGFE